MKSIQSFKKFNLLQGSAYRLLWMLVNYVQNLDKTLYNNLPSCLEGINISSFHGTIVNPTWNTNCQTIGVPLKAPGGFY